MRFSPSARRSKVAGTHRQDAATEDRVRRGGRRRHHGRRHRDEFRERGIPGDAARSEAGSARSRHRRHPQVLRRRGGQGQAETRRGGEARARSSRRRSNYAAACEGRPRHRGGVRRHRREEGRVPRARQGHAKRGAILATNTSTLDVDRIAAFTKRPGDVLGMHFFSPANIMKLLEVVRAKKTRPDVLATVDVGRARRSARPPWSRVCATASSAIA